MPLPASPSDRGRELPAYRSAGALVSGRLTASTSAHTAERSPSPSPSSAGVTLGPSPSAPASSSGSPTEMLSWSDMLRLPSSGSTGSVSAEREKEKEKEKGSAPERIPSSERKARSALWRLSKEFFARDVPVVQAAGFDAILNHGVKNIARELTLVRVFDRIA